MPPSCTVGYTEGGLRAPFMYSRIHRGDSVPPSCTVGYTGGDFVPPTNRRTSKPVASHCLFPPMGGKALIMSHVSVADTSHVNVADTSHVNVADTSHVNVADTSHVNVADIVKRYV